MFYFIPAIFIITFSTILLHILQLIFLISFIVYHRFSITYVLQLYFSTTYVIR